MWEHIGIESANENIVKFPTIAVFISGNGTNLQSIIDDGIDVALVFSDQPSAYGLERAKNANIKTHVIDKADYKGRRKEYTREIVKVLKDNEIELIVLAGFMTIFSPDIFDDFSDRMLNTHPSLLPAFTGTYGLGTMTATLEAGVKVTGVTVHIVTSEVDAGPILAQAEVPVLEGDDENILLERIQKVEHVLYPQTIRQYSHVILNEVTDLKKENI